MSLQPALIEYASPTLASLKCGSLFSLIPADMLLYTVLKMLAF